MTGKRPPQDADPKDADIVRIAKAEEQAGVVDQQAAASAAMKKAARPANEGRSATEPAEGADDAPAPLEGSPRG